MKDSSTIMSTKLFKLNLYDINNKIKTDFNTKEMIFSIEVLLSYFLKLNNIR